MTNQEIIFRESCRLMEAGILSGSGRYAVFTDENGDEKRVELPEAIHTFAAWKSAGYTVKRGEHAVATFPVWKYSERRRNNDDDGDGDENDGETASGRMYLRKAYFFKFSQVEKITA